MAKYLNPHNFIYRHVSARIIPLRNFITNTIHNGRDDSLRNVACSLVT